MSAAERLRSARENSGFGSASEAARAMRINVATYIGHENGSRGYGVEAATRYGQFFGVSSVWLLMGEGPGPVPPKEYERVPTSEWDPADNSEGVEEGRQLADGRPYRGSLPGARPEIDVRPGAGHGHVGELEVLTIHSGETVTGHPVIAEWVMPESFYRHELHAKPAAVLFQEVVGDSMWPTLQPGDRVIVDLSQNAFGPDAIYVFHDGDGEPRVKRLAKVLFSEPPLVEIISDNPIHEKQTVEIAELRIVGRVVGRVHKL